MKDNFHNDIYQIIVLEDKTRPITIGTLTNKGKVLWIDNVTEMNDNPLVKVSLVDGIKFRILDLVAIDVLIGDGTKEIEVSVRLREKLLELYFENKQPVMVTDGKDILVRTIVIGDTEKEMAFAATDNSVYTDLMLMGKDGMAAAFNPKNYPTVSRYCTGEKCFCGNNATQKIEQVIFDDMMPGHGLTQYKCQDCFERTMMPYKFKELTG